jgi:aspartate/methionine/tyrosine aminotransferase
LSLVALLSQHPGWPGQRALALSRLADLQDFVMQRLQQIPGVTVDPPQGAFYVMPEVSAFVGEGVQARGWGPVPDVDALCRWAADRGGGGRVLPVRELAW